MLPSRYAALVAAFLVATVGIVAAPRTNANGCITPAAGTSDDPYIIATWANLNCLRTNPIDYWGSGLHFLQTANIDLAGADWGLGIGISGNPFQGSYDGNGFQISGLSTTDTTATQVGLFGETLNATIRNTHISGSLVGEERVGGLIGLASGTSIIDSSSDVTIVAGGIGSNPQNIGGLIGEAYASTITRSRATGDVSRHPSANGGDSMGGLIGNADDCTISASSASGLVSGRSSIGGLVGFVNGGSLSTSFATGSVTAASFDSAGLVGTMSGVGAGANSVVDVYARGSVTSTAFNVGALVGQYYGDSSIGSRLRGYATGLTTGSTPIGGFVGAATGNPNWTAGYWDTQTTGRSNAAGSGSPTGLTGQTTIAMKNIDTYIAGGWSISTTWSASGSTWGICSSVNDGYPYLQATYTSDPCPRAGTPSPTVFTLALDANGGVCTSTSVSGDSGTWVALPAATACTREGFTLAAWSTSRTGGGVTLALGGFTLLTDNNALYAIWQKNTGPMIPTQETPMISQIRFENLSITRSGLRERRVTVRGAIRGLAPGQSVQCWFRTSRSAEFTPENVQVTQPGGTFVWTHATRRQLSAYCVAPDGTPSGLLRI